MSADEARTVEAETVLLRQANQLVKYVRAVKARRAEMQEEEDGGEA